MTKYRLYTRPTNHDIYYATHHREAIDEWMERESIKRREHVVKREHGKIKRTLDEV